jgi:hypothetical protein
MFKKTRKGASLPIVIIIIIILLLGGYSIYYFLNKKIGVNTGNDLIKVEVPLFNQEIQSPYKVLGQARGTWYFEATFPVKLLDENGNIISQTYAQAQGDWMTDNFVPFESTLTFSVARDQKGTLVLEKDNPSGMPQNSAEIRIPVMIKAASLSTSTQKETIKLYYYNPDFDKDSTGNVLCSSRGLVAVERQIPITNTPIQDTIKLLISGNLTSEEKAQGVTTEYPLSGFFLVGVSLNNGILTLGFSDPNNKTSGGSCRAGILWFQIEATAKQFSGVQQVHFSPEDLFQP